jgi:hypothetical protein
MPLRPLSREQGWLLPLEIVLDDLSFGGTSLAAVDKP